MDKSTIQQQEPICALATAPGVGALSVVRVSGKGCIALVDACFKGQDLSKVPSHTVHFGTVRDGAALIDEVLVTVFRAPRSFTREDAVEISCHGSDYIVRQLLKVLVRGGARIARPGEFTERAFLNGRFDLVQAEAVADLIAADSAASHRTALRQLRGGFSKKLAALREELIHFASLVELELDFGEEDVEFARRDDLRQLIASLQSTLRPLIDSFDLGNALKEGVPVAIIGSPNVGKSTLLNALLNEEKAIVTEIAGTTRDVIEDTLVLEGVKFRFIDTAGIRETRDVVESLGVERSRRAMEQADLVVLLFDSPHTLREVSVVEKEKKHDGKVLWVRNKSDLPAGPFEVPAGTVSISAATRQGLEALQSAIVGEVKGRAAGETVVTNQRHYGHLVKTSEALDEVLSGLDAGVTGDFLAQDIRLALYHLGEITGAIVSDDLLANIFSKFCIGK